MLFSSTVFLFLFLPLTLCIYYNPLFTGRWFRNMFLLLASLLFYAWGEPVFVFLMLLSIGVGYFIGLHLQSSRRKWWMTAGVLFHVGLLFIFKYLTFVLRQLGLLVGEWEGFAIALPIGISFFTFQILSYLFDVYYGKTEAQRSILNLGLYVALFPQLIAGPIVRYNTIENQIMGRTENLKNFADGMMRFIYGLGKKVLIADYMAVIADNSFNADAALCVAMAWMGAIAYTLQIYFDFSGYSDMAIGLGKMFGFQFQENFNYPYIARSATDFWERWHISLSSWFRDYVYIPMGGNRVSTVKWIWNLFVVWILTGIWHGANWTFLCWGMFWFVLLLAEKLTNFPRKLGTFSHIYALLAIILGWTMFRSESLLNGINYIGMMFGLTPAGLVDETFFYYMENGAIVLVLAMLFSLPILAKLKEYTGWRTVEPFIAVGIFFLSLIMTITSKYSPFIYFNF